MDEWIIRFAVCFGLCVLYFVGYTKGQNDAYDNIIERLSEDDK